jgi:hypothetical protein
MSYKYNIRTGIKKIKTKTNLAISGAALTFAGLVMAVALPLVAKAANATTTITPTNFNAVFNRSDVRPVSSYNFVTGPANPPLGVGSLELSTVDSNGKQQHLETQQQGSAVANVDSMSYSTYRHGTSTALPVQDPAINMEIFTSGSSGYTTLVFEPVYNIDQGPVVNDTWQNWDAYNGGTAIWWSTHDLYDTNNVLVACNPNGALAATPACAGKLFVPFSVIQTAFPNATIISYGVNQGSGNPGLLANVDALSIGINGNTTTYDFEPYAVASDKDSCKNGGWMNVKRNDGTAFKNQGDCVSYTNNGR